MFVDREILSDKFRARCSARRAKTSCKTSRFDCRLVILAPVSGRSGPSQRVYGWPRAWCESASCEAAKSEIMVSLAQIMDTSSFLYSECMRIAHTKFLQALPSVSTTAPASASVDRRFSVCRNHDNPHIFQMLCHRFRPLVPRLAAPGRNVKHSLLELCTGYLAASQHWNYCDATQPSIFISTIWPSSKG